MQKPYRYLTFSTPWSKNWRIMRLWQNTGVGKGKKTPPHKTQKRREAKRIMLAAKKSKRRK